MVERLEIEKTAINGLLGGAAFCLFAGACKGYLEAQGLPLEDDELGLTYVPSLLQSAAFGMCGGIAGLIKGATIIDAPDSLDGALEKLARGVGIAGSAVGGAAGGAVLGSVGGGIVSIVETSIGYYLGYFAGSFTN